MDQKYFAPVLVVHFARPRTAIANLLATTRTLIIVRFLWMLLLFPFSPYPLVEICSRTLGVVRGHPGASWFVMLWSGFVLRLALGDSIF